MGLHKRGTYLRWEQDQAKNRRLKREREQVIAEHRRVSDALREVNLKLAAYDIVIVDLDETTTNVVK